MNDRSVYLRGARTFRRRSEKTRKSHNEPSYLPTLSSNLTYMHFIVWTCRFVTLFQTYFLSLPVAKWPPIAYCVSSYRPPAGCSEDPPVNTRKFLGHPHLSKFVCRRLATRATFKCKTREAMAGPVVRAIRNSSPLLDFGTIGCFWTQPKSSPWVITAALGLQTWPFNALWTNEYTTDVWEMCTLDLNISCSSHFIREKDLSSHVCWKMITAASY